MRTVSTIFFIETHRNRKLRSNPVVYCIKFGEMRALADMAVKLPIKI